jgi:N,N-dimethylformamidase
MSDGDTPALYGYASSFSAAPGETITFHVSGENVREYQAQLVRLRHGYDGPGSPGFLEQERASGVDGQYAASYFRCAVGSYVEVDDPDQQLRPDAELRFGVLFYATTPELACQGLLGSWSEAEKAGYALSIEEGHLVFRVGDGEEEPAELRLAKPIQSQTWYAASAGWNGADGSAFVKLEPCGARTDRAMPAASPAEGDELRARLLQRPVPAEATPFRIGALSELGGGTRATWAHFNGKLERPWAAVTRHTRTTSAVWDFGASDQPDGLLLDAVVETGGAGLHGRTVNQPTRAVTGHNWTGRVDDYRAAPEEYGAIHLHDDDLDDPGWPPAFSFTVPEDLDSGVYAMRLRGAGCEEHVVFFVRPAAGGPRNRVAVLFPTGSYLAYANDHLPFDAAGAELLIGHVPVLHRDDLELQRHYEFGHSCYETHSDGSGVFFSSRRRPIVNMRPRYRAWFMADAFWQFPADLAIVDWLEAQGIGWDAITDEDLHRDGLELVSPYAVVLTGSHPEYVSGPELDALEAYVSAGGRLMYLGGNGFYWLVSYHPDKPYLMEVRRSVNGARPHQPRAGEEFHATSGERCGLWRNHGRAPQRLTGVGFAAQGFDRSTYYERLPDSFDERAAFVFEGVGDDERIGDFGICGGGAGGAEIDRFDTDLGSPPGALLLASTVGLSDDYLRTSEEIFETPPGLGGTQDPDVRADLVYFTLRGGGAVFSTGSIAWTGSLSHNGYDNNVSRITGNVLRRFLAAEPLD